MPRHITRCSRRRPVRHSPDHWVVVETLSDDDTASVIIDGIYQRDFANLNRVAIATSAAIARRLHPLVRRCTRHGRLEHDDIALPSETSLRIYATPIFGPNDHVYGVGLCIDTPPYSPPTPPAIGAVEWNRKTGTATVSAAVYQLLELTSNQTCCHTTLSDVMRQFDRWDDRDGFLALFDPSVPTDRWTGTAATRLHTGIRRHLYIAARSSHTTGTIRALVCGLSTAGTTPSADCISAALRGIRLASDQAVGIIDLRSGLIHEWVDASHGGLLCHSPHTPKIHPDDAPVVAEACIRLLTETTTATEVLRIGRHDDWVTASTRWTLICQDNRPQALLEITVIPQQANDSSGNNCRP
nr:GAF domain-containing protein [Nocardia terpenica]